MQKMFASDNPFFDQSPATSAITLRPVAAEDDAFLLELYATTRADEMAMVPWTPEQQQAFIKMQFTARQEDYQQKYPTATHEIILSSDRPVGHLYVARLQHEVRIIDITIMPLERNGGIGTFSLRQLLNEAARTGKLVRVYVESYNPSLRFFERLSFKQVEQHGVHFLLEWTPTSAS
jgi:RimJ/RimL family protein N-acetyltransferase